MLRNLSDKADFFYRERFKLATTCTEVRVTRIWEVVIMALMDWEDKYSVKVLEMDNQHKKIMDMINKLHDAQEQGHGPEVVGATINELVSYTVNHFKDEEALMERENFPELAKHKIIHQQLVKQVGDLSEEFKSKGVEVLPKLMAFLKTWLTGHILGIDMKYCHHIELKKKAS